MKIQIKLCLPENGSTVSQLSKEHELFLTNREKNWNTQDKIDWLNLQRQGKDRAFPEPIVLQWNTDGIIAETQKVYLNIADNKELKNSNTYACQENRLHLYNLLLGKSYFWKVIVVEHDVMIAASEQYSFTVSAMAPRWIKAGGLSNIRDIGGWPTVHNKKVKQGLVYRGCEMEFHYSITDEGKHTLVDQIQIKTDLDLREEAVGRINKSALGDGVRLAQIPAKAYDDFLAQGEVCKRIFKLFTAEENYPFYVHCWGGADRTGTVIFLLCGLLDVQEEDLLLDYELTSFCIWGGRSRKSDLFQAFVNVLDGYGDKDDSINEKCKKFLLEVGVTKSDIYAIREILLE